MRMSVHNLFFKRFLYYFFLLHCIFIYLGVTFANWSSHYKSYIEYKKRGEGERERELRGGGGRKERGVPLTWIQQNRRSGAQALGQLHKTIPHEVIWYLTHYYINIHTQHTIMSFL